MGQCLERFGVEGNWRPNLIIWQTQVNVLDGVLRGGVAADGNFLARTVRGCRRGARRSTSAAPAAVAAD
jgi:hypothetical protein